MGSVEDTDSYSTDYSKATLLRYFQGKNMYIYITLLALTITFGRHLVTAILISHFFLLCRLRKLIKSLPAGSTSAQERGKSFFQFG